MDSLARRRFVGTALDGSCSTVAYIAQVDMEYDLALVEWPPLRGFVKWLQIATASLGFSFVMGPNKVLHE